MDASFAAPKSGVVWWRPIISWTQWTCILRNTTTSRMGTGCLLCCSEQCSCFLKANHIQFITLKRKWSVHSLYLSTGWSNIEFENTCHYYLLPVVVVQSEGRWSCASILIYFRNRQQWFTTLLAQTKTNPSAPPPVAYKFTTLRKLASTKKLRKKM